MERRPKTAQAVTRLLAGAPDELFDALREHFSEAQLVELTVAIAFANYRAWFNLTFGMRSEGFPEGSLCALPETQMITTGGEQQ